MQVDILYTMHTVPRKVFGTITTFSNMAILLTFTTYHYSSTIATYVFMIVISW